MSASEGDAIEWTEGAPTPKDRAAESAPEAEVPEAPEPTAEEVRASLADNGGNILRTARALGLSSRYVLYRLMKRYGIGAEEGG